MMINDFSPTVIANHQTWYLLKNTYKTDITVVRPTPVGPEPYLHFSAYRMANGQVLLGFNDLVKTTLSQGLIAIGPDGSEYITTQVWERIAELCQIAPPNDDLGTFAFVDSQPPSILEPHKDWRCDKEYYGPYPYPTLDGVILDPLSESSVIVAFEPIISLAGIGHLIYMQRTNYQTQRNELVNNALTPMTAPTLPETLKLVHEWAAVGDSPFENQELIAQDAKDFVRLTGLTSELLAQYPDMQIFKFLQGDENARVRPADALPIDTDLLKFVRDRVSHVRLNTIVQDNPAIWDLQEVIDYESETLNQRKLSFVSRYGLQSLDDLDNAKVKEQLGAFFEEWLELYENCRIYNR